MLRKLFTGGILTLALFSIILVSCNDDDNYDSSIIPEFPEFPTSISSAPGYEFIFEGKRWLDLRRFGDSYVFLYTGVLPSEAYKVLWPIDRNSLTNNTGLTQTPGYPSF